MVHPGIGGTYIGFDEDDDDDDEDEEEDAPYVPSEEGERAAPLSRVLPCLGQAHQELVAEDRKAGAGLTPEDDDDDDDDDDDTDDKEETDLFARACSSCFCRFCRSSSSPSSSSSSSSLLLSSLSLLPPPSRWCSAVLPPELASPPSLLPDPAASVGTDTDADHPVAPV